MNSPGTLNYFKILLHRSNVNGKVKGQFRPHHDLLMMKEQFLEYFEMDNMESNPENDLT